MIDVLTNATGVTENNLIWLVGIILLTLYTNNIRRCLINCMVYIPGVQEKRDYIKIPWIPQKPTSV